ncbi:glycerol-3-phosphate phosphatase [Trichonephila inaurata madagascariensis]|uniref:Glycerol-3-phosphate phosphatase n=1 Tax=Trichonephila inaurata madagascariensis TaxID=2747483 RepID=A0A8X6X537_9ARAC|nr:glycerol-3-phosphate phosphatase [Trichonephila inaurata madagascariensis]
MAPRNCVQIDNSIISSGFFDSFDYVLTDCDGVLWMGNDPIPGAVETIKALKNAGKHIIYVTNNSTKSRDDYVKKCEGLGFPVTYDDIISTSYCAAAYLQSLNFKKKVYVFGSSGITLELEKVNIQHLPIGPDPVGDNWIPWLSEVKLDPEVGAVIVGFDHHVSYPKLIKASSYLKNPDTLFIATNRDEQFPADGDLVIPGAGTFVISVEVVSQRKATAVGKPERFMLDCIKMNHPDIDFSRCIMIGDRLNTDILLGTRHGLKTLFVGTGHNSIEDVRKLEKSSDTNDQLLVPDYYLPHLGDLLQFIKA